MACPVAAKPPADKGPPAHAQGGAKAQKAPKTAKPDKAPKAAKPGKAPQATKAPKAAKPPKPAKPVKAKTNGAGRPAAPATPNGNGNGVAAAPPAAPGADLANARSRRAARARAAAARRTRGARAERRTRAQRRARAQRAVEAAGVSPAPADAGTPPAGTAGGSDPPEERARSGDREPPFEPVIPRDQLPQPLRVVRDVVEVIPTPLRFLIAGLAVLSLILAIAYGLTLLRNRRLANQRRELLGEVGLLQAALLPDLPDRLASSRASVAYRPADGLGAGGDFYDVISLAGGQTAVLIGDVSGHGRAALAHTALARYTLRAYAEAGLEPREALQIAGAVLAGKLQGDFVTALLAVHDAGAGTLTYASAGHPPPIVISSTPFEPVLAATAPPLGVGSSTGQRQTTLPFPRGAVACFYTDGLSEARTADGQLGTARLERLVRDLGPELTAKQVIDRVTATARTITDDAAVCVLAAEGGPGIVRSRVEHLEVSRAELRGPMLREFLEACGVSLRDIRTAERDALDLAARMGGAIIEVRLGERPEVEVRQPEIPLGDARLEVHPPVG